MSILKEIGKIISSFDLRDSLSFNVHGYCIVSSSPKLMYDQDKNQYAAWFIGKIPTKRGYKKICIIKYYRLNSYTNKFSVDENIAFGSYVYFGGRLFAMKIEGKDMLCCDCKFWTPINGASKAF